MRFLTIFICFIIYHNTFGQINYYIGANLLNTRANVLVNNNQEIKSNPLDFGIYIGNELQVYKNIQLGIDVFYQNNNTILNEIAEEKRRFEFHQNIGIKISPAYRLKKNTLGLNLGVTGMYIFDKKEATGNQIDRYDEAYIYGLFFNRSFHPKWSFNLSILKAKFDSSSHYTNAEMKGYNTFSLGLQYNLFGKNE